jgi:TetR/AcrR family transcriptional regulator, regulator of cefoperazone and chloramphenicol sensitivity
MLESNVSTSSDLTSLETRARLLEAAADVFVEFGYRSATLREICRRARANNAAVNYHFRDKQRLYLAVVEHLLEQTEDRTSPQDFDPTIPPDEKLRAYIRTMLRLLLGSGRPTRLLKLMSREMVEPTPGMDLIVEIGIRPLNQAAGQIVQQLLGPTADEQLVADCVGSVLAQCVSFHHSQAIIERLAQHRLYDEATIEHLADHVTEFSLGGIRALAQR